MTPRLEAIGIIVSDMARSLAFYRRLGLDFPEGAEGEGHVEAQLPGGLRYMVDTEELIRSFEPEWKRGESHGGAFRCDSPDEVDRVYAELLDAGATAQKEPWDAFWGQRYAQLKDPDGIVIDLFAELPEEQ
jgi:catechol 2,3-dioxygenase-like lactoylglutathione lyase family enzyme